MVGETKRNDAEQERQTTGLGENPNHVGKSLIIATYLFLLRTRNIPQSYNIVARVAAGASHCSTSFFVWFVYMGRQKQLWVRKIASLRACFIYETKEAVDSSENTNLKCCIDMIVPKIFSSFFRHRKSANSFCAIGCSYQNCFGSINTSLIALT